MHKMAAAAPPTTPSRTKCGICLEVLHKPRRLLCQHCYCEDCLDDWIKHNKGKTSNIICPYCKKPTRIPPDGVKGIPAIDMAKANEDYSNNQCSKCKKPDNKATVYCKDCKHYLCQSCYDLHKFWAGLNHHRIATITDLVSGNATLSDINDQYCTEHEGEEKKFYCDTCKKPVCRDCIVLKQCCRDHDTMPIKQAADKKLIYLNEAILKCSKKKQECQKAIDQTVNVEQTLSSSASNVKDELKRKKAAYVDDVQRMFKVFEDKVEKLLKENGGKLGKVKSNLSTQLSNIKGVEAQAKILSESQSPLEIMSQYKSMVESLQQVNQVELDRVDETLAKVPTPESDWVFGAKWAQIGQIKVPSRSGYGLTGIAVASDGKIAVCDYYHRIHVFSKSGDLFHTIDDGFLGGTGDVSITPTNGYVVPKHHQCCQLYDNNYTRLSQFKTYNANNKPSIARAVTVDKNGCIILGMNDDVISIHKPDGSLKSSFAIPYQPYSVAVTSHEEIVVASYSNHSLQLFNYSGKCLLTFDTPPDVSTWNPIYACCSKRDEVFVSNQGNPKAIYRYASSGVYMGCVATDVSDPWGIALSHDDQEFYVVEHGKREVKIFKRP